MLSAKTALLHHTTFRLDRNINRALHHQSSFIHSNIKINHQQHSILHGTDQEKSNKDGSNDSKTEKKKDSLPTKEYPGLLCTPGGYVFALSCTSFKIQFNFLLVDPYTGDKSQNYATRCNCDYRKPVLQTKPFFTCTNGKGKDKKK